jgi:hypothetical protein
MFTIWLGLCYAVFSCCCAHVHGLEPPMACHFIHVPRKRLGMSMHGCRNTGNTVVVSPDVDGKVSISCFVMFDFRLHFVLVFASSTCGG